MKLGFKTLEKVIRNNFEPDTIWHDGKYKTMDIYFSDGAEDTMIRINFGLTKHQSSFERGIHLHSFDSMSELDYLIRDAIETACKDGFETIWIHNKGA